MAGNFWRSTFAWVACFISTIVISFFTKPKPEAELEGLVWGKPKEVITTPLVWYKRPGILAIIVVVFTIAMNLLFF